MKILYYTFDKFEFQDYRLDFSGKKEILKSQKKILQDNQSLLFAPTVCLILYTGNSNNNNNNNNNDQIFRTEFTNWLDADFWTDLGPKARSSFQGKQSKGERMRGGEGRGGEGRGGE